MKPILGLNLKEWLDKFDLIHIKPSSLLFISVFYA